MTDELQPMDDDILKHLKAQAAQPRKRAAFFTWYDRSAEGKGIAEAGAVDDLLGAMRAAGRSEYHSLGASGEDWPDVWLENAEGQRIPCEVAELVDAAALPDKVSRPEMLTELIERLQEILDRKGMRSLGGRSGPESVLVAHTDELYLDADSVAAALNNVVFKKPVTIQRAFLLISYNPTKGGYRYFDLPLAA
jgi:hypothetical protein